MTVLARWCWIMMAAALFAYPAAALASAPGASATAEPTGAPQPAAASATPREEEDFERPYVYQVQGNGPQMSGSVQYEVGYGTRATRFFGDKGVEQRVRLRFQPWRFLSLEGWGGLLVEPDGATHGAGAFHVTARALRQSRHYVDLDLGAGYLYDYRGHHVARLRASLGRRFGRLDMRLGSALEVPLAGQGDTVDVMLGAAASYRVTSFYRQGLEVGVEDLEGFWDPNEMEGGAKVLFGPTAHFTFLKQFELRLNLSAVYAHLANQVAVVGEPRWGLMGRVVLGYLFR